MIAALHRAGHVAYLAGGCVRDRLLGLTPTDHDVATDARPEDVRRVWRRSRYVGEAFGVVLARVGDFDVEVATFRLEADYHDHRRPDHVEFTNAREDARRRDFTINGLFEDPAEKTAGQGHGDDRPLTDHPQPDLHDAETRTLDDGSVVIDYVGGLADLEAGVIRAIGDPTERFDEDYLRMLRAARFAARLGFALDDATARAIGPLARFLGSISRERIGDETRKMLTRPRPAAAAALCQDLRLDGPALNEDHRNTPLPTLAALEKQGESSPLPVALAAWMIDRHTTGGGVARLQAFAETQAKRVVKRWRDALCLSNDERDRTRKLLQLAPRSLHWGGLDKAGRKRLLAEDAWPDAARLLRAAGGSVIVDEIDRDAQPLRAEGVAPEPLITGDDLIAMGLPPGPRFKRLLAAAYDAQLNGETPTRDDALAHVRAAAGQAR